MKARLAIASAAFALLSCASTRIETTGSVLPRCSSGPRSAALVLWKTQWRSNQKDVEEREEAALRGIEDFFRDSRCFSAAAIHRIPSLDSAAARDYVSSLTASGQRADRMILLTVHELGPVIRLCASPALVEGGTEVLVDVQVIEHQALLADCRVHWQNGGPFAIKNTRTLRADMKKALSAALDRGEQSE